MTCQVARVGKRTATWRDDASPRVILLRGHVSLSHLPMYHFLIGPRVIFLLVHVSFCYSSTCLMPIGSRVSSVVPQVYFSYWSTCLCHRVPTCLLPGVPHVVFLELHVSISNQFMFHHRTISLQNHRTES